MEQQISCTAYGAFGKALAAGAVGMSLLLGASAASAETVIFGDPSNPGKATAVEDVNVGGTLYDVEFVYAVSAQNVYGPVPGDYDFNTASSAETAVVAVNAALNAQGALFVGDETSPVNIDPLSEIYFVGFQQGPDIGRVNTVDVSLGSKPDLNWIPSFDNVIYSDNRTWAVFTPADGTPPPATSSLAASSLPSSRSVQVGSLASAFATIINTSNVAATSCGMAPQTSVPADFAYQTTDAANAPVGAPNTPADIPAGGSQNFVFGFLPTETFSPTDVLLTYDCTNSDPAPVTVGLNTLLLSAEATPVPDIVALAATPTGDGILNLPGTNGANAFAVSTVNVGSTATITASPRLSTALPVALSICETNPGSGACLSAAGPSATSSVGANATSTYSVFAAGTGTVPFDPAANRIIVEFTDGGGVVRGSTSVAVRTQ